jgi:hypothetical protein
MDWLLDDELYDENEFDVGGSMHIQTEEAHVPAYPLQHSTGGLSLDWADDLSISQPASVLPTGSSEPTPTPSAEPNHAMQQASLPEPLDSTRVFSREAGIALGLSVAIIVACVALWRWARGMLAKRTIYTMTDRLPVLLTEAIDEAVSSKRTPADAPNAAARPALKRFLGALESVAASVAAPSKSDSGLIAANKTAALLIARCMQAVETAVKAAAAAADPETFEPERANIEALIYLIHQTRGVIENAKKAVGVKAWNRAVLSTKDALARAGDANGRDPLSVCLDDLAQSMAKALNVEQSPDPCYYERALIRAVCTCDALSLAKDRARFVDELAFHRQELQHLLAIYAALFRVSAAVGVSMSVHMKPMPEFERRVREAAGPTPADAQAETAVKPRWVLEGACKDIEKATAAKAALDTHRRAKATGREFAAGSPAHAADGLERVIHEMRQLVDMRMELADTQSLELEDAELSSASDGADAGGRLVLSSSSAISPHAHSSAVDNEVGQALFVQLQEQAARHEQLIRASGARQEQLIRAGNARQEKILMTGIMKISGDILQSFNQVSAQLVAMESGFFEALQQIPSQIRQQAMEASLKEEAARRLERQAVQDWDRFVSLVFTGAIVLLTATGCYLVHGLWKRLLDTLEMIGPGCFCFLPNAQACISGSPMYAVRMGMDDITLDTDPSETRVSWFSGGGFFTSFAPAGLLQTATSFFASASTLTTRVSDWLAWSRCCAAYLISGLGLVVVMSTIRMPLSIFGSGTVGQSSIMKSLSMLLGQLVILAVAFSFVWPELAVKKHQLQRLFRGQLMLFLFNLASYISLRQLLTPAKPTVQGQKTTDWSRTLVRDYLWPSLTLFFAVFLGVSVISLQPLTDMGSLISTAWDGLSYLFLFIFTEHNKT